MSDSTFIKPDRKTEEDTKAGNYFIANYPPFSFWNEKIFPAWTPCLIVHLRARRPLGCITMCRFAESGATFVTFGYILIRTLRMYAVIWTPRCRNLKDMLAHLTSVVVCQSLSILAVVLLPIYRLSN